ncbi:MAG: hypothetical protein IJ173_05900 [Kiritimatiellae bacterium]|nr:hypothetical protein [Kiritimatiellia bacterium]
MNRTTVKSTAHLVASLALRHVAQRHGGAHRGWSALAAAFFTVTALADNNVFQQGVAADGEYLASNSANWGQPGQVSTNADTGETTITGMSFSNPYTTTFDKLINTSTYIWVGSTTGAFDGTDAFAVWRAKDDSADYGISQTSDNLPIADASGQTGKLKIESGTYNIAGDILVGITGGTGALTLNGGELKCAYWFATGRNATSRADININGGRLLIGQGTTSNGMFDLCNNAGSSATFTMTGGYVYAPGSKNNADSGVAFAIGNNSTANVQASISGGEMYLDGKICVPRAGTGSLALSGTGKITVTSGDSLVGNDGTGTFTMSGGVASFRGLNLGSTSSGNGTFNLSGGDFTANNYTCIGNGGTGSMVQTGGTYTQANTVFIVGQGGNANASGSYRITDGSLAAPALYVAENATPGTMEVAGGSVKITGDATFSNNANSGNSSLAVSAGAMDVSGQIKLAQGASTHGTITVSGGALTNHNWFCVGSTGNSGYTAEMTITGGEVYNEGNTTLASAIGNSSSSSVAVSGGKFANTGDIYIGECNTIADGGVGSASFTLSSGTVDNSNGSTYFDYKNNSVAGSTFALTISGGEYITKQIKHGSGSGTATINLGGGTLKASAGATSDFIPANNNLSIVLATGTTTTIDTNGKALTIGAAISGSGTLRITGGGSLVISQTPSASIAFEVEDGTVLTVPCQTAISSVSLDEQSMLILDASGLSDTYTLATACPITLPQGYDDPDWFVAAKGGRFVAAFDDSNGLALSSIRPAAEGEGVVNVYLGNDGTGSGEWRTTGQWSLGAVPTSVDTAIFVKDGTLTDNVADTVAPSNIMLKTSRVKFIGGDKWPKIRAQEINGIEGATIVLSCYGLGPTADKNLACRVNIDIDTDTKNQDCWIEGNGETSRIAFYGGFYATNSAFRVNQAVDFYGKVVCNYTSDNDNYFNAGTTFQPGSELIVGPNGAVAINAATAFQGNVTVDGVLNNYASDTSFAAETVLSGSGTLNLPYSADFAADIKGALTINLTGFGKNGEGRTYFRGDNSAFTGYLNSSSPYHNPYFAAASAGSAQARFNFVGDVRTKFAEGVIKFGEAKFTKNDWCVCYIEDATGPVVFEIGALSTGEDMIGEGYSFGSNKDKLTIRKVGTGLLSTWGDQYQHLEIKSGTVALKDNHGPSGTFIWTGGTARFDYPYTWDPSGRFDFVNSTGPIDIDTAGNSFTWATAFAGSTGIVKRGEGTLYLSSASHTFTGSVQVLGGTLLLPYRDMTDSTLAVAEGAALTVDMSAETITASTPVEFAAAADDGTVSRVQLTGATWDFDVSRDATTGRISYTATAPADTSVNRWIGAAGGDWHVAGNWQYGIPTASQTVVVDSDTTITYAVDYNTKQMPVGTLNLVNGATFTLKAVRYDGGTYNRIVVGAVEGTGKIVLDRAGLGTLNALTVPASVEIEAVNNGVNDSWIEGNGGTLTIEGPVSAVNRLCTYHTVVINGEVTISGKLECIGTLTLAGNVANAGTIQCNADNTLNIAGAVTGAGSIDNTDKGTLNFTGSLDGTGTLTNNGKLYFSGTMDDFTGTVTLKNNDSWFYGNCTGAANAEWKVNSDMHFESTSNNETPATFYMGSIAISAAKRFYLPNAATMALYIGSGYMRGVHFGDSAWDNATKVANLSVHKVGTGELATSLYGCPNWVVEEGSLVFETLTGTWHTVNSDDKIFFNYGNTDIDSVIVQKGAVLSGALNSKVSVSNVKFDDGAYFGITLGGDENTPAMLTATSFEFGKNVYGILSNVNAEIASNGQIYSGTLTGSPMATVLNGIGGSIAASGTTDYYWTATYGNDGVWLKAAQVAATTVATGAETSVSVRDADLSAWLTEKEATAKVDEPNANGVTGILAYMLGAEDYTNAAKPTMGATVADGVATLTFDDSAFRRVPGLKLAYYLESCDKADFSGEVVRSEESDDPAVALEFANAKIFNRLCADVRASE